MKLEIKCKGASTANVKDLLDFQGDLKTLSNENYLKFKSELLELGFSEPISVWVSPEGKKYILNGHQRRRTLLNMISEGIEVPDLPINLVEADDIKQAKRKVLALTSQFGEMSSDSLLDFCEKNDLSFDEMMEDFRFPELEGQSIEPDKESEYTEKVDSPVYEPKEDKPNISELYSVEKAHEMASEINEKIKDDEIRGFLISASMRHIVFNYAKIAEYYCHADKDTQDLMERSALVIIDFKKAIENGYVELKKDIVQEFIENDDE